MFYIFLDESGDLGFSERSSNWFVLSIVMTKDYRRMGKCVKKIHSELKKKHKKVKELHAYHADNITKKRILRLLSEITDLQIFCIVLNKKKIYFDLRSQKNYLYNYAANALLGCLCNKKKLKDDDRVIICIDQRETNKFLKNNFENYLIDNLIKIGSNKFDIKIKPSHTDKCLQAVDFVSWAIFRKYERGDYEYYEIIKNKIIGENLLFP